MKLLRCSQSPGVRKKAIVAACLLACGGILSQAQADPPKEKYLEAFYAGPQGSKSEENVELPPAPVEMETSDGQYAVPENAVAISSAQQHLMALQSLETAPIDLASALALVGIQNPEFLAAQQRTLVAIAERQAAAAKFLPTINLGGNYNEHGGVFQQSSGNMLKVSRQSAFVGAGANSIAAGSINIPGILWEFNPAETVYNLLASRQVVAERQWAVAATRNQVELKVVEAYLDLLQAAGTLRVAEESRNQLNQVAQITTAYARTGQGRPADAARAMSDLARRDAELMTLQGTLVGTSARLSQQIGLDTAVRLVPTDPWVVPHGIVPEPIPLNQLLVMALLQRPELQQQQREIRAALLELEGAKALPFSPTVFMGYGAGAFGGGSNLASQPPSQNVFGRNQARFGNFRSKQALDVMFYWTLKNLGVGNHAQIEAAASRLRQSQWEQVIVYDEIREQVASAYARVHARYAQMDTAQAAVKTSLGAWEEDLKRIKGNEGLPIEVLDSQRLLFKSQVAYVTAIINYNRAQFELYQSLGNPPANMLIRYENPALNTPPVEPPLEPVMPPAEAEKDSN